MNEIRHSWQRNVFDNSKRKRKAQVKSGDGRGFFAKNGSGYGSGEKYLISTFFLQPHTDFRYEARLYLIRIQEFVCDRYSKILS